MQMKDGKRVGLVENQISRLALSVVQHADSHLSRKAQEAETRLREIERQKRECEEVEQRRIAEQRRQAELACQDRLLRMAEDWQMVSSLASFLEEITRRIGSADVTDSDRDLLERWLRWGASVAQDRDPFTRSLGELPEVTHPGIRDVERRARKAQASETQRPPEQA
jgi:GTP1/Obg family GTP-binding protein